MKINHNNRKRKELSKNKNINEKTSFRLKIELQQLEASKTFGEYYNIPRTPYARVHALSGNYSDCFGVGLDPRNRMVIEPSLKAEKVMQSLECSIIEYCIDYH